MPAAGTRCHWAPPTPSLPLPPTTPSVYGGNSLLGYGGNLYQAATAGALFMSAGTSFTATAGEVFTLASNAFTSHSAGGFFVATANAQSSGLVSISATGTAVLSLGGTLSFGAGGAANLVANGNVFTLATAGMVSVYVSNSLYSVGVEGAVVVSGGPSST